MTVLRCDRCLGEAPLLYRVFAKFINSEDRRSLSDFELCNTCLAEIKEFIETKPEVKE